MKLLKHVISMVPITHIKSYAAVAVVSAQTIQYTDGFYYVRLHNTEQVRSGIYSKSELTKELHVPGSATERGISYPGTAHLIPTECEPVGTYTTKTLIALLKALSVSKATSIVTLEKDSHGVLVCKTSAGIGVCTTAK